MRPGGLFKLTLIIWSMCSLCAQEMNLPDSLEQQLQGAEENEKLEILVEQSKASWGKNPAAGTKYANEAIELAIRLKNNHMRARALMYGGVNNWYLGLYDKAMEYYHEALEIAEANNDKKIVAFVLNNIGMIHFDLGEYEKASENFLYAAEIMNTLNDPIEYAKIIDNIAKIYVHTQEYEEALDRYLSIIEIIKKSGNNKFLLWVLSDIGSVYFETNKYNAAQDYYFQALDIGKSIDDDIGKAMVMNHLGALFIAKKEYSRVLYFLSSGLKFAKNAGAKDKTREIYFNYSQYYSETGDYKNSLEYYKLFKTISDSILNVNKIQKILEVQTKYEIDAKEKENELLRLDNKIKQLEIDRQTTLRNYLIAFTLAVLVMVLLILSRLHIKRKANLALSEKNKLITDQKEELHKILDKLKEANEELTFQKKEIKNQADELAESNAAKDKLFSIISHDLKGPFNSILGYLKLLTLEYENFNEEERQNIIADIDNSANSTFKLLNNMLTWSMSQLNAIEIKKEKLQLSKLVNESIEPYLSNAVQKEISVSNEIPDDFYINADSFTLSTVFGNLTNNAIKFTPAGGDIKITARKIENFTEVSFSDTGIGMDAKTLDSLFRPGKNSSPGTRQEKGTGLGLIITGEFIKLNNGNIRVESEVGRGSTFIVSVPD